MLSHPFSEFGHDLRSLEGKIERKADSHEVASLARAVDRLEHSVQELRAENDELRSRCERLEEAVGLDRQERTTAADAIEAIRSDIAELMKTAR